MKKKNSDLYKGFTLVEMLIVMAIFMVLFGMGIAAFSGLRNTVLVNENSQNLQQDIRWAQRAAILLKRESDEKWLYGVGIDLRNIAIDGNYTVFKWCSPFNEYADGNNYTSSDFPNYDPEEGSGTLGPSNGNLDSDGDNLPEYYSDETGKCPQTAFSDTPSGELVEIENRASANEVNTDPTEIEFPLDIGLDYGSALSDTSSSSGINNPEWPAFVVFESITGKTFFYNYQGALLNYEADTGAATDPIDVGIAIVVPNHESGVLIKISHDSGKVTSEGVDESRISTFIFFQTPDDDNPPGGSTGGGTDIIIQPPSTSGGGTDGGKEDGSDGGKDSGGSSSGTDFAEEN